MRALRSSAARLFATAVDARNRAFDLRLRRIERIPGAQVVSVGGIEVGGTGKTPLTLHLAQHLAARDLSTAIVTRGYRGRWERSGGVISAGDGRLLATSEQAGDEATMFALRCPSLAVVVGADRVAAALHARSLGAEVIVLDSGFQHRRLHRQLDIVTLSPEALRSGELVPLGSLREPLASLSRADLVVIECASDALESLPSELPAFQLRPTALVGRELEVRGPVEELAGKRVALAAGIARPERFARTATSLGVEVVAAFWFRDHHRFSRSERRKILSTARARGAEMVLTTEKDLVRFGDLPGLPLRAIRVEVEFSRGEERVVDALWYGLVTSGPSRTRNLRNLRGRASV